MARQWMHSTSTRDASTNADALLKALMPNLVPGLEDYTKSHPPPPQKEIFERILQVFQTTSEPDDLLVCKAFLDVSAEHMGRTEYPGQRHSTFQLVLSLSIDRREPKKPEKNRKARRVAMFTAKVIIS